MFLFNRNPTYNLIILYPGHSTNVIIIIIIDIYVVHYYDCTYLGFPSHIVKGMSAFIHSQVFRSYTSYDFEGM